MFQLHGIFLVYFIGYRIQKSPPFPSIMYSFFLQNMERLLKVFLIIQKIKKKLFLYAIFNTTCLLFLSEKPVLLLLLFSDTFTFHLLFLSWASTNPLTYWCPLFLGFVSRNQEHPGEIFHSALHYRLLSSFQNKWVLPGSLMLNIFPSFGKKNL